ncbi:MoaD/ThiS family protein [Candidatus Woesearchaeota archaeon]|nr:MoaD/ThiS family protein [Candidatus Woesearchaeota archaeon]
MELFIEAENKRKKLKFSGTVSQLLQKLKVNPETVIVAKNNQFVTENEKLADKDDVKLLSVISGG